MAWNFKLRQSTLNGSELRPMESDRNFGDKRRHKRFRLKMPAFAVVDNSLALIAEIVDISSGGLAIRYLKNNGSTINTFQELDLFNPDIGFYLDSIQATIVSDYQIISRHTPESKEMRRCGLRFENLSSDQIARLENIIRSYSEAT